jgi:hypothetical protein
MPLNESSTQKFPTTEKDTHKQEVPIEMHHNQFASLKSHSFIENESQVPHITGIPRDNDGRMNTSPTKLRDNLETNVSLSAFIPNSVQSEYVETLPKLNRARFYELQRTPTRAKLSHQGFVDISFSIAGNFSVELSIKCVGGVNKKFHESVWCFMVPFGIELMARKKCQGRKLVGKTLASKKWRSFAPVFSPVFVRCQSYWLRFAIVVCRGRLSLNVFAI